MASEETSPLLSVSRPLKPGHAYKPGHVSLWRVGLVFILLVIPLFLLADLELPEIPWPGSKPSERMFCPQVEPLSPILHRKLRNSAWDAVGTDEWLGGAVAALSGAVKINTETFDTIGNVGEDPAWAKFDTFHAYLRTTFPLVHERLSLTTVNTYGLVYEWKGSNETMKPILLAAHQDTVPVDPTTVDQWTHPPWSGIYDGKWIWGRGSVDDKLSLISILLSLESLLEQSFEPTRSIILAFGFDEEISGTQGAANIAKYLEEKYGRDAFAMLIDEGGGIAEVYGAQFASPAVGEKGYLDVRIEVGTPGGHSSIPPANHHTGIGILSQVIVTLENNTMTPRMARTEPIYNTVQCIGEHAPGISHNLRRAISQSYDSDRALRKVEEILFQNNDIFRSIVGTTQAVDVVGGGVKSNALPESSWAIVNTRIATDSSVSFVKSHYTNLLRDYAIFTNITLISFGKTILDRGMLRKIELSDAWGTALEPAPVSPLDGEAYKLLSGTILSTEQTRGNVTEEELFVMPFVMSGNTDTRYYWSLTKHIFRYGHIRAEDGVNIHTVDEHVRATALPRAVRFFINLILNADESRSL